MNLTPTHARFYLSRKPVPLWAREHHRAVNPQPSIDACVNAHAGLQRTGLEPANLLSLLRLQRTASDRVALLARAVAGTETHDAYSPRAIIARRWLKRVLNQVDSGATTCLSSPSLVHARASLVDPPYEKPFRIMSFEKMGALASTPFFLGSSAMKFHMVLDESTLLALDRYRK